MNNSYNVENGKEDIQQSWWKKRSSMEKKLSAFSAFALLIIIVLVIVLIIFFTRSPTTCLTPGCVHITNELLEHMNTSANPCDDFYEFACGNFIDNTQLDGKSSKGVDTILYDVVNDRIRGIIEEPEYPDDPRSILLAKRLYKACNNQTAIDERDLRLIKDSLRQIGGWPILEGSNWKEKDFEWKSATYKLRELGYDFEFFIVMRIIPDENYPSQRIIELRKPVTIFSQGTGEEEEWLYELMVDIAVAFGADKARAKNEFREVIDFQKRLLPNQSEQDINDEKYNPLTISELQYQFRDVPWLEYINRLQFPAPNISYDQIVAVPNPPYLLRLQNELRRTPKRVLANYVAWRTISNHFSYLTTEIWDLIKRYFSKVYKDEDIPPRPELCAQFVDNTFDIAIQAAYIRKHFSENAKFDVVDILQSIKNEFKEKLTKLSWMDEETRVKALERLASTTNYAAYPSDLMNLDKTEEPYMGFQVDEDNFLASTLNVNYYKTNLRFQRLHEPVEKDKELLATYATYTESYYSSSNNIITVPAGFLQGVIYDYERPEYLNYGALGSTVGHQVYHAVFEGKNCERTSKYYDWITTQTLLNFNEKLSCVAMHYGKYPVPEIGEHLNSSNTKYEDIADMAGVKLAYDAYKKWVRHNGPEQNLPGLNYTPKQLFWISSAIRFCKKSTPAALEMTIAHHYKSPSKYRALGILRNSEDFANDFNCPASSYMNDEDKCEIW
ncbi:hypothetical protein ILUMI_08593 [Ignelater luminosus]|uniref:Uncharacterized protein n=1 Tax=Ignelater luminosus TaxID=2038154 RepID=A0A8K0D5F1_IGNLU|nr:hypothetical protein ILUMI_08593 [Ignelater luminosus]